MKKMMLSAAIFSVMATAGVAAMSMESNVYAAEKAVNSVQEATGKTVINATDRVLNLGESYNPMEGVTATDANGTDITNKIQVVTPIGDTSIVNNFPILYTVTDSNNEVTNKMIMAEVKPFYRAAPVFSFTADNYINGFKVKFGTDIQAFVKDLNITAVDADNKDITANIMVDYSQIDTNKSGLQHLTFTVTDDYGKTNTNLINVTVEPKAPVDDNVYSLEVTDLFLQRGAEWKRLDGVKASINDIDITMGVQLVESNVNMEKIGTYHATYRIYGAGSVAIDKVQTIHVD